MNIAIIGTRDFNNYNLLKKTFFSIISKNKYSVTAIVSGGAGGADKLAEKLADDLRIKKIIHKADWETSRKSAGPIRNSAIIKDADVVIAFWDGQSDGTKDTIEKAQKANKRLFVIKYNELTADPPKQQPFQTNMFKEGVSYDGKNFNFDFTQDKQGDIVKIKVGDKPINKKKIGDIYIYYFYKIKDSVEKEIKRKLLLALKDKLIKTDNYNLFLDKAVMFFENAFDISTIDIIIIPQSSSSLNFDIAKRIKDKVSHAYFIKDTVIKNNPSNIQIDMDLVKKYKLSPETVARIQQIIDSSGTGSFNIKKLTPRIRKFVFNVLKFNDENTRQFYNRLFGGNVLVIDDFVTTGATLTNMQALLKQYQPNSITYYTLLG